MPPEFNPTNSVQKSGGRICVFAKTPELGKVKTRLEPVLGKQGSLVLHKWLVKNRLESLFGMTPCEIYLYVSEDTSHPYWQDLLERQPIAVKLQRGDTLGARMYEAIQEGLSEKDWVILIGADCPDLDLGYLNSAIEHLESGSASVVGPAEDGGYVLLGLSQDVPAMFESIDWGTSRVLAQTLDAAEKQGVKYQLLNPLRDLDTEQDLAFYLSRYPCLSELLNCVTGKE